MRPGPALLLAVGLFVLGMGLPFLGWVPHKDGALLWRAGSFVLVVWLVLVVWPRRRSTSQRARETPPASSGEWGSCAAEEVGGTDGKSRPIAKPAIRVWAESLRGVIGSWIGRAGRGGR